MQGCDSFQDQPPHEADSEQHLGLELTVTDSNVPPPSGGI